jgi:hypothetical protein
MSASSRVTTWGPSSQCDSSTWHLPISGAANASHDVFFLPRGCLSDAHMHSEGSNTGQGTQLGPWTVPQGRFAMVAQRWEAYSQYAFRSVLFGPKLKVRRTICTIRYGTLCTKYASHNPGCDAFSLQNRANTPDKLSETTVYMSLLRTDLPQHI